MQGVRGVSIEELLREIEEKNQTIASLRATLIETVLQIETLKAQNTDLIFSQRVSLNFDSEQPQQESPQLSGKEELAEEGRYQLLEKELRQVYEQRRKHEVESYDQMIAAHMASKDLLMKQLAEQQQNFQKRLDREQERFQEQQRLLEDNRRHLFDLTTIFNHKRNLIADLCLLLSEHFQQEVKEDSLMERVERLVEERKRSPEYVGEIADVLNSLRESRIIPE